MKYKVGDKLRVKKDLKIDIAYFMEDRSGSDCIVDDMLQFSNQVAVITHCNDTFYQINLDKGAYYWTDEMFEGLVSEKTTEEDQFCDYVAQLKQLATKQEEIPYINAVEAREMFDVNYTADKLRKLVYGRIRNCAKTTKSTVVNASEFPLEIRELICKELEFKGFSTYSSHLGQVTTIKISW